jgi:hypothetical protein
MTLFSKTVAEQTRPGQRQDVEEQGMHMRASLIFSPCFFAGLNC